MPNRESNHKKAACHNCIKRRIICDKTGDSCHKCAKKNLACPGYGIRYRFAKETTSSSVPSPTPSEGQQGGLKHQRNIRQWIEYSGESVAAGSRPSKTPPAAGYGGSSLITASSYLSQATIPRALSELDPRTRCYFLHFAVHVSHFMVIFDDEANGYRHHVLPMAHSDPLVQKAVCIVSAFHLSAKHPRLRPPAEVVRADLIRRLSRSAAVKPDLSETAWATLLLLTMADLITGHEDVTSLMVILNTFVDARGPPKESASGLEKFLYFQSSVLGFFRRPFSPPGPRPLPPQRLLSHPVATFEAYTQGLHNCQKHEAPPLYKGEAYASRFPLYEEAFRLAGEIYTARMEAVDPRPALCGGHDDRHFRCMKEHVRRIRALCEQIDPAEQGTHVISWPIFVAAMESCSESDREFFAAALRRIWERCGYANISRGLETLPELWDKSRNRSWTSVMGDYKGLVVC
ncbi:uncharacterized protein F4807DRAFT_459805 [Annulohypoxylon truncatum]|uniref:uncharacterized protein n=1 Tax=Annulohypoxylon truncatum TaxID=327061 RepID=UPI002008C892|nr:uncharacterized protein F4807DRAFT_459805 [Annulohypoxylon truncatum]KAI1210429.1 hypothetical protein F4807DRAFT_459805 [Annulohypoxylon truncatum]